MTNPNDDQWSIDDLLGDAVKPTASTPIVPNPEEKSKAGDLDVWLSDDLVSKPISDLLNPGPATDRAIDDVNDGSALLNAEAQAKLEELKSEAIARAKRFGNGVVSFSLDTSSKLKSRWAEWKSERAARPVPVSRIAIKDKTSEPLTKVGHPKMASGHKRTAWILVSGLVVFVVAAWAIKSGFSDEAPSPDSLPPDPVLASKPTVAPVPAVKTVSKSKASKVASPVEAKPSIIPPPVPPKSKTEQPPPKRKSSQGRSDSRAGGGPHSPDPSPGQDPAPSKQEQDLDTFFAEREKK